MGHIELAAPVSHIWYFKGIPSRMGLILSMSPKALEKVLYFGSYIVLDPGRNEPSSERISFQRENIRICLRNTATHSGVGMGAEAIKELLCAIDLRERVRGA